jgi:hypothetical protein
MNYTFVIVIWAVLGAVTLALAVYRMFFAAHNEEDVVHLAPGEEAAVQKQATVARKMATIDHWGKILTVITVVIGLGLAGAYLYQAFNSDNPGPNNFFRMNAPAK